MRTAGGLQWVKLFMSSGWMGGWKKIRYSGLDKSLLDKGLTGGGRNCFLKVITGGGESNEVHGTPVATSSLLQISYLFCQSKCTYLYVV